MADQILSWALVILPVAFGFIMIAIPTKHEDQAQHKRWRNGLGVLLIAFGVLTWIQQSRALKASVTDREKAISETSEKVSAKVAADTSASVTKTVTALYSGMISDQKAQIAQLQNQLAAQGKDVSLIKGSDIVTGKNPVKVEVVNPTTPQNNAPEIRVAAIRANPDPRFGKNAVEFVLTTDRIMNGGKVHVECATGKINQGNATIGGGAVMVSGGGLVDDHNYVSGILLPNWSPNSSLVITIYYDGDLGGCKFTPL